MPSQIIYFDFIMSLLHAFRICEKKGVPVISVKLSFLDRMKKYSHKLTKSQKLVAEYICNHLEKSTYMTATKIGIEAGVSETTVIRFTLSLGYKNFSDFQEALQEEFMNSRTVQRLQEANKEINKSDVLFKSFDTDIQNIQKTLQRMNIDDFQQVAQLIGQAETIYTIGFRSSTADAYYLGFSLHMMLGNAKPVISSGIELEECLQSANENSVIIAFSFPRYTIATLDAITYLKNEKQATIVSVTDSINSPVASLSDYLFLVSVDSYTPKDSHVASIALINAIISAVGQHHSERVKTNLNELESYLKKVNVFYY